MITAEQRLARADKIGSSDAAAILGLDPYRSAADIYLEKIGAADGFEGNENTERGNVLEPALRQWCSQRIGQVIEPDLMQHHRSGLLLANLDGAVLDDCTGQIHAIVEAKTTVDPEGWGEEGTDQVPERVLAQVAHQFVCVPTATLAYVPVLMPGFKRFDFRLYKVARNEDLCRAVEEAGLMFMQQHVIPRVPPDDFRPSLEVLRRVRREPNKIVPVADELVERFLAAKQAMKDAAESCETAQSYLLAALGDAEGGTYSGGTVSYLLQKRATYAVEATEFRQLRIKKNKKGGQA